MALWDDDRPSAVPELVIYQASQAFEIGLECRTSVPGRCEIDLPRPTPAGSACILFENGEVAPVAPAQMNLSEYDCAHRAPESMTVL